MMEQEWMEYAALVAQPPSDGYDYSDQPEPREVDVNEWLDGLEE